MKVLFVIKNEIFGSQEPLGILYLSSVLKTNGHHAFISDLSYRNICLSIRKHSIDIIAVSCMDPNYRGYLNVINRVKAAFPDILFVWGGPTPTYNPEIIKEKAIDIVCRGEGEYALLDLVTRLESKQEIASIRNLWVKENGKIYRNEVRPFADLNTLPFPDRSLTGAMAQFKYSPVGVVTASRGCPFSCSFCYNDRLKELYKNKGKYVRVRSVDNVIAELIDLKTKRQVRFIYFVDDVFPYERSWLEEFGRQYTRSVRLPFYIVTSAAFVNDFYLRTLKDAGCVVLNVAIETANEKLRKKILNKIITNERIQAALTMAKRYGLELSTYNIIGIPHGRFEDDIATLDLNLELNVDTAQVSFCMPFHGTRLGEIARKEGVVSDRIEMPMFFEQTPLNIPDKEKLKRFSYLFSIIIAYPSLRKHLFLLLKIPFPSVLLKFCSDIIHGNELRKSLRMAGISPRAFFFMAIGFIKRRFSK